MGIHTGHDAGACLFANNTLLAFCKEERLSRIKNDGGFFELESVDEVLRIAGLSRQQVDAVAFTRMKFPVSCFRIDAVPLKDVRRKLLGQQRDRSLASLMLRRRNLDAGVFLDFSRLRKHMGLRTDAALPPEFTAFATTPDQVLSLPAEEIGANRDDWIEEWNAIVLG